MPVEIRELVITAAVSDPGTRQQPNAQTDISDMKDAIVKECVQQVLKKLKEKTER